MNDTDVFWQYTVSVDEDGKQLKKILKRHLTLSRRMIRRLKVGHAVLVNGKEMYFTDRVQAGDQIVLMLPVDKEYNVPPQPIPFHIHYEDEDIMVINKQAGLVVHPTGGHPDGTLANGWVHYFQEQNKSLPFRPVTRLDRNTSGLMVVAKHAYAHAFLAKEMKQKKYHRTYIAWVNGVIQEDKGEIWLPLGLGDHSFIQRVVRWDAKGTLAITQYRTLQRYTNATQLEIKLLTGKTHQIRAHFAHMGYPLLGDSLYGAKENSWIVRQALHASALTLFHPRYKEWMSWKAPLSEDLQTMQALLPCK